MTKTENGLVKASRHRCLNHSIQGILPLTSGTGARLSLPKTEGECYMTLDLQNAKDSWSDPDAFYSGRVCRSEVPMSYTLESTSDSSKPPMRSCR